MYIYVRYKKNTQKRQDTDKKNITHIQTKSTKHQKHDNHFHKNCTSVYQPGFFFLLDLVVAMVVDRQKKNQTLIYTQQMKRSHAPEKKHCVINTTTIQSKQTKKKHCQKKRKSRTIQTPSARTFELLVLYAYNLKIGQHWRRRHIHMQTHSNMYIFSKKKGNRSKMSLAYTHT